MQDAPLEVLSHTSHQAVVLFPNEECMQIKGYVQMCNLELISKLTYSIHNNLKYILSLFNYDCYLFIYLIIYIFLTPFYTPLSTKNL